MSSPVIRAVAVKLDDDIRERMKRLSESRQRSTHWMMREAIQQYLEREEKREAYKRDGLRAWEDYQATGQHLTAEEADAWLARLEDGQKVERPDCHA